MWIGYTELHIVMKNNALVFGIQLTEFRACDNVTLHITDQYEQLAN